MNAIDLYLKFRAELDKMWIPIWLETMDVEYICVDDKNIGMVCGSLGYIDAVYILPEYRRKGLAKKAVLDWYNKHKLPYEKTRLHIINNNNVALKFWNSIFVLRAVVKNETETLYEILRVKE